MNTMMEIEALVKIYAEARDELRGRLQALRDEVELARRAKIRGILNSLARFTAAHDVLLESVTDSKELFVKPKSQVLHGIKVGWQLRNGKLEFADADRTVELIEELFPDQARTLIRTTKEPIAAAVVELSEDDRKAIGARIADDVDVPFVRPVGDDLDKLMKALLKGREEAAAEEAVS